MLAVLEDRHARDERRTVARRALDQAPAAGREVLHELGPLAFHANASVLVTPSAQNLAGVSASTVDLGLGGSVVWLATPGVNLLVEAVWRRAQEVVGPGRTGAVSELYLAPGLRAAIDLPGGVQVVPGVGWAIPAAFDAREGVLLAYLSVENTFGSRLTPGAAPFSGISLGA